MNPSRYLKEFRSGLPFDTEPEKCKFLLKQKKFVESKYEAMTYNCKFLETKKHTFTLMF